MSHPFENLNMEIDELIAEQHRDYSQKDPNSMRRSTVIYKAQQDTRNRLDALIEILENYHT